MKMSLQERERTTDTYAPVERRPKRRGRGIPWRVWLVLVLLVAAVAGGAALGTQLDDLLHTQGKLVKIGFEDIGVLETQVCRTTQVKVVEASRELFGKTIPFTQSKYIYSYDVDVKAGLDLSAVKWSVHDRQIVVALPPVRVTDCTLDPDSFRVYHEQESLFRPIRLEENNAAVSELQQAAQDDALAHGLLEQARNNAEKLLRGFFSDQYDPKEYTIVFTDQ
ncbi:MAG: DUF4230 domain-containing protein [Eubacteriales bacterium]|nr:DUF4230 domain-containing protein [Eubacteriales bacterium]